VSLASRILEAGGISCVVIGSARDIVEECGVSRFLYSDFPLGNPCGKPWVLEMQRAIIRMALELLTQATHPRTTLQTPFVWDPNDNDGWRENYMRIDDSTREALANAGRIRRLQRQMARVQGDIRQD
jgi:hypothetical protein|tara:strand:- start:828 stop:1208 length:381 start_codon:yes stop_codon:yes gene_type:complete